MHVNSARANESQTSQNRIVFRKCPRLGEAKLVLQVRAHPNVDTG